MLHRGTGAGKPGVESNGHEQISITKRRQSSAAMVALQSGPSPEDLSDESLATSFSALDISREHHSLSASKMACSSASSSLSPEQLSSGQRPGGSKRRSVTEMSQSARMTPQSQRERGLGMPWLRAHGLCIVDVQEGDIDEARKFCLLPTPELGEKPKSAPSSPELHSPSSMQRRFVDLVHRASLGNEGHPSGVVPASPETKRKHHDSLASQVLDSTPDTLSPISPMHDCSPVSQTTLAAESQTLSRQLLSSNSTPSRIPLIHRLDERLSKSRNSHIVSPDMTVASTFSTIAPKDQPDSFIGNQGLRYRPACGIYEDEPIRKPNFTSLANTIASHTTADSKENASPLIECPVSVNVKALVQKFDRQSGGDNGRARLANVVTRPIAQMRRSISRSPLRGFRTSEQSRCMLP